MAEPLVLSLLEPGSPPAEGAALRAFLERLVEAAAKRGGLVVGEAEPGRYLLVMPPLEAKALQAEIDAGLDVVLRRLGERWPAPHVTDLGLRELYPTAREPWLHRQGMEPLVQGGKVGVVTIFCHDWLYAVAAQVAAEHGLRVETPFEEYLRTGRVRYAGTNAFQLDVFANVREMAANFDPIDHLVAKLLVIAAVSKDEALAAKVIGRPCPKCGARVAADAKACPACRSPVA